MFMCLFVCVHTYICIHMFICLCVIISMYIYLIQKAAALLWKPTEKTNKTNKEKCAAPGPSGADIGADSGIGGGKSASGGLKKGQVLTQRPLKPTMYIK